MGRLNRNNELTLTGAPADIASLPVSQLLKAFVSGYGKWTHIERTHYDTFDGDLAAQDIEMSIVDTGKKLRQEIFQRSSGRRLEATLSHRKREFAPTGVERVDLAVTDCGAALSPIAHSAHDCWLGRIQFGETGLRVEIYIGERDDFLPSGRALKYPDPLLRVRLDSGPPSGLYEFARLLMAEGNIWLHSEKIRRPIGNALSHNHLAKMPKIRVSRDDKATDALRAALLSAVRRIGELAPHVVNRRDDFALYQLRVALRRLRAIERCYRPYLKSKRFRSFSKRARVYGKILGPARDWNVFLAETLPAIHDHFSKPGGIEQLTHGAQARRAQAFSEASVVVADLGFRRFTVDLAEFANELPIKKKHAATLDLPLAVFAPKSLERRRRKTFSMIRATDRTSMGRHRVRLALKKLRYTVQLFRTLYPKEQRAPYMAALSRLQDAYGKLNDAAVAQDLANQAASGDDAMRVAGFLAGYFGAEASAAQNEIEGAVDALEKMTPFWRKADELNVS